MRVCDPSSDRQAGGGRDVSQQSFAKSPAAASGSRCQTPSGCCSVLRVLLLPSALGPSILKLFG